MSVSALFLSAVVLPCVNNAPEHAVAMIFAAKGKINVAVSITLGSAAQLAAFVLPFGCLLGWAMDQPMTLKGPEILNNAFFGAVVLSFVVLTRSRNTWFHGVTLLLAYIAIAIAFMFANVPVDPSHVTGKEMAKTQPLLTALSSADWNASHWNASHWNASHWNASLSEAPSAPSLFARAFEAAYGPRDGSAPSAHHAARPWHPAIHWQPPEPETQHPSTSEFHVVAGQSTTTAGQQTLAPQ